VLEHGVGESNSKKNARWRLAARLHFPDGDGYGAGTSVVAGEEGVDADYITSPK
jgi:hypothetical protein|tara:strand:- start:668 stop:829 length:162 start_codon:yes stop_codon:yes gene_type:complete